jgi:hypothetical protein
MSIRAKMMFLNGGFGTSSARMLKIMPSVKKFPTKTAVTIADISIIIILALMPANARTEGKL